MAVMELTCIYLNTLLFGALDFNIFLLLDFKRKKYLNFQSWAGLFGLFFPLLLVELFFCF